MNRQANSKKALIRLVQEAGRHVTDHRRVIANGKTRFSLYTRRIKEAGRYTRAMWRLFQDARPQPLGFAAGFLVYAG